MPSRKSLDHGFTLIEILIVISIIALLSSFVLIAVTTARKSAADALATQEVQGLSNALGLYVQDESEYPGMMEKRIDADSNLFPILYDALFGDPKPKGPGGRSAPYMKIPEKKIAVWDTDSEQYVQATPSQLNDRKVKKYLLDQWENAYVYRPNKGRKVEDYMHNKQAADIYSWGENGIDDTAVGNEKSDDIGNW